MKKIGILTSGGDAPGMNACIRAAVRAALANDLDIFGIRWGYAGLIRGDVVPLDRRAVANIILAHTRHMPPFRNSIFARILLWPPFMRHIWLVGLLLMLSAPALNFRGLFTYFTTGKVYIHWSFTLAGSLLFLLGLSLLLWGSLVRVLEQMSHEESRPVL